LQFLTTLYLSLPTTFNTNITSFEGSYSGIVYWCLCYGGLQYTVQQSIMHMHYSTKTLSGYQSVCHKWIRSPKFRGATLHPSSFSRWMWVLLYLVALFQPLTLRNV